MQTKTNIVQSIIAWFDNDVVEQVRVDQYHIDYLRVIPFIVLHLACFAVVWVGFSWFALGFALALYVIRMFAITGFYHRYFAHKAFQTSRLTQFLFAVLGETAVQRGPLWWASHHRDHHRFSDQPEDAHSPKQHGFLWSHFGWFLATNNFYPKYEKIKDFAKFPELRFLDRFDVVVPLVFALAIYGFGAILSSYAPQLNTNGWQLVVWGFAISTIAVYHGTFTVNSLAHVWGSRRYQTGDDSRNHLLIALITMGEGWHNNHHHYERSARQGFFWWEVDITYYMLKCMAWLGIIWNLKTVPEKVKNAAIQS